LATLLSLVWYFLLLAGFLWVWARSTRTPSAITPFALFGVFEIVSVWPATIYADASGLSKSGAYPALVAGVAFAGLLLGFVITAAVVGLRPEEAGWFRSRTVRCPHPDWVYLVAIAALACALACLGFYLYQGWPPLIDGLLALGDGGDVQTAINIIAVGREAATKGHYLGEAYRGQGVILELLQDGWPFLVAIAALRFLATRSTRWAACMVVLFGLMLFFIAGSGQRWQVLASLVFLAITLCLAATPRPQWVGATLLGMLSIYVGMSILNSNFQGIENTADPVESFAATAASRIVLANGLHDVQAMNFVEDGSLERGFGAIHVQKVLSSIPGVGKSDLPFAARLSLLLDPYRPETDTSYASETYLGWLDVDFGLPGAFLVFTLVGALLAQAQKWVFAGPKGILDLPVRGFVIFYLGELALDGPATMVAALVVVVALYVALRTGTALLAGSSYRWGGAPALPSAGKALSMQG
jgi:hypothetical protein